MEMLFQGNTSWNSSIFVWWWTTIRRDDSKNGMLLFIILFHIYNTFFIEICLPWCEQETSWGSNLSFICQSKVNYECTTHVKAANIRSKKIFSKKYKKRKMTYCIRLLLRPFLISPNHVSVAQTVLYTDNNYSTFLFLLFIYLLMLLFFIFLLLYQHL